MLYVISSLLYIMYYILYYMLSVVLYILLYILYILYIKYTLYCIYCIMCPRTANACVCVWPQTTLNLSSYYNICLCIHIRIYIYTHTYIHTSIRERRGVYAIYFTYIIYTTCIRLQHTCTSTTHACGRGELPLELLRHE